MTGGLSRAMNLQLDVSNEDLTPVNIVRIAFDCSPVFFPFRLERLSGARSMLDDHAYPRLPLVVGHGDAFQLDEPGSCKR